MRSPKPPKPTAPEYEWGDTPAGKPETLWEYAARPLWAQVLAARGSVLLMEMERLRCRTLATGATLWEQPAEGLPDDLAHDAAGIVLATGAHLREVDPATGEPRWRARPGGVISGVALDRETLYAASNGPLFALDRRDGSQRWRTLCGEQPELYPWPGAGLLVVDDLDRGSTRAHDAASGALRWEFDPEGEPTVSGPLTAGVIPISAHAAGVTGVDAASGSVRWTLSSERAFEAAGLALGETLFFTDGTVHAVDAGSGERRWHLVLQDEEDGVFALRTAGEDLLADTWSGRLLALDPATGTVRWERRLGQVHGVAAGGPRLYLRVVVPEPEERWAVVALDRASGEIAWQLHARRNVADLTCVGDVLLVELKNHVLALRIPGD